MTRGSGQPRWVSHEVEVLTPVALTEAEIDEDWLQTLLDKHPDVLPIDEIDSSWGPLISIGREVEAGSGYIDNLFVSPTGRLTILEAKLWRNPEARRKVVGQILDYAAALSKLSYADLDALVGGPESNGALWSQVCASPHRPDETTEAFFVDNVTRSLRQGHFLLLIAGDGIREDLDGVAHLLRQHPGLRFHLELVELRLYRSQRRPDDLLVVPSLVGRTSEVVRGTVEVRELDGQVQVHVSAPDEDSDVEPRFRYRSIDQFAAALDEKVGDGYGDYARRLATWWENSAGGNVRYNQTSITLVKEYVNRKRNSAAVVALYDDGTLQASVQPLVNTHGLCERELAVERFAQAGFEGSDRYPETAAAPGDEEHWIALTTVLEWVADRFDRTEAEGDAS